MKFQFGKWGEIRHIEFYFKEESELEILKNEIDKGNFREDLYHRLAVILIDVPTLSSRKDDIPLLIDSSFEMND